MRKGIYLTLMILLTFFLFIKLPPTAASNPTSQEEVLHRFKQNDRWGYIDVHGVVRVQPQYIYADDFSEGLAYVLAGPDEDDSVAGFINTKGEWIIEPKFYLASKFSEGLAMVDFAPYEFGCIDREGNVVFELTDFAYPFSEGLSAASDAERGMGYIDHTGKWVIEPIYWPAESFSEGLACVCAHGQYGYINQKGEVAIPLQYYCASSFSEGLAWVQLKKEDRGYYITKTGERVDELDFPHIGSQFSEGVTYATHDKKHYGYVNQKGEWVIAPQYTEAKNFSGGLAFVKIEGKSYFIDKSGTVQITLEKVTSCVQGFQNGLARVNMGREQVIINTEGKVVFTVGSGW